MALSHSFLSCLPLSRRSPEEQVRHHRAFFLQFFDGGVDFHAAEFVDRHALNDGKLFSVATHGKRGDESLLDTVATIRANTNAVPIADGRRLVEGAHAFE